MSSPPARGAQRPALIALALTGLALVACHDNVDAQADTAQDTTVVDTLEPDTVDTVDTVDTAPDTAVDTTPDTGPGPGELGAPCSDESDCNDSYCLTAQNGKVCSKTCTTSCPNGWACRQNLDALPDVAFTCMPPAPNLCRPCTSNADCLVPYDGAAHACVPRGDDGAFCGAACASDDDCPDGAFCAATVDTAGNPTQQCQLEGQAECPCSERAIAEGARTTCKVGNALGRCQGERVCTEAGLTACDAAEPALDLCNGQDDNCDGRTDEAFVPGDCAVENELGACPGTTRCDPANGVVCDGQAPTVESCNGEDDDCDGETDEEDATGCAVLYRDTDGDEFGEGPPHCLCQPDGFLRAQTPGDCDDSARRVFPDAPELCNGVDDDCDGATDEGSATGCTTFQRDADRDGFGDPNESQCLCAPARPYDTRQANDCDDNDSDTNPATVELCNAKDDDCDGQTDEEGAGGCVLYFADSDQDAFGATASFKCLCAPSAGFSATLGGDCNDSDQFANPGRPETCNGKDDDCDGLTDEANATGCSTFYRDADGDHYGLFADKQCLCAAAQPYTATEAGDCNDGAASANPGAVEVCDGIDNDCDVVVDEVGAEGCVVYYQDRDLDGRGVLGASSCLCGPRFPYTSAATDDCDDTNPFISPAAAERCNGLDDDCNGQTDEGVTGSCSPFYKDADSDGWGVGTDQRCLCAPDGEYTATRTGDCDDRRIDIYPFADELCNGEDDDCDGETDEADALGCVVYFKDGDGDAIGVASDSRCLCAPVAPYASVIGGDCDDTRASTRPGAAESCNGRDDNCDGRTDEVGALGCSLFMRDTDGDAFGLALDVQCLCAANNTYRATVGGDCDDLAAAINPAATETCDGKDNDCNGVADDPDQPGCVTFYRDVDGDTYGVSAASQCLCAATGTFTATRAGDCNDLLGTVNPSAAERCNLVDDDCDGATDERDALACTNYLRDADNDNFGVSGDSQCLCAAANPYRAVLGGDCADNDATRNPGQTEACNGKDDDCNGSTDPDGSVGCLTRYRDGDGDTYGLSEDARCLCTVAAPYSAAVGGDCDDSSQTIRPGVTEVCNNKDDNCDGRVDEAGSQGCTTYYLDADGDRYGVAGQSLCLCAPQAAYSATVAGDCDDGNAQKNPGRTEACNSLDDDCDGQTDETGALGCALYWTDADSDTYGVTGSELCVCAASGTRTAVRGGDCDDTKSTVSPERAEVCDSVDNNCDTVVDDSSCGLPTIGWPTFMRDARRTGHPFFIQGPTDATSTLRWKKQLVANTSFDNSPVIDEDGNIYILLGTKLFKLDPNNGNTLWQKDLPATPFSRASPTVRVGGTVLVPAGNRVLLYGKDGTLIWTADFGGAANDKVMGSPVVDQSGAIYVVSNTHIRSIGPAGNVIWATAITADTTKSADPAIGPDGRIYFTGTSRVYSFAKTGTKNWDWCPLSGGNCDATKAPGTSVTVNEIGRVLAPMGNTLYLLADAQTQATQVSSLVFTTNGGKLWANLPIFSTGYTCCNPEEYPLATPAGSDGLRALTASMTVEYTKALTKRDQANGAGVYDRDGDIFIGNNNTGGKARFSARKNRDAGTNASTGRGTEYWGYDVDGAHIDGAPALGGIGNIRYVVFGDSSGTIYQIGK